ncbi:hypothetical protein [Bacteroides thetaiotaomicron]|uniref:hypothetical protein n=1 Tax=Bacteroides thetaiotaomicron TaxID=818 RepID=UPI00117F115C|nr:hypothetical protein [Bacteroides thetaiotaomicron]QZU80985.1 hypothetical protein KHO73_02373 [Bacteroides thetaiotaomicron]QZU86421.1 hypothetical protein KHO74_02394 [Bacteroides thetaiotaomicron]TSE46407.1 hypothetical protein EH213_00449 [Bacteroides thetaiotaomicron]
MESDSLHEHDKSWKAFFITTLFILCTANVYAQSSDTIFSRYFRYAQNFADSYPREKVSLHLDNASYYLGDTIWFKAYVVTAEQNLPTTISKPLYVELLDQLGNVVERQIIQLTDGEGTGQIILNNTFFTGYYEMRAYTKWMLAFDNPSCFSRVLPVYRKRLSDEETPRSIATYRMDASMKQRPKDKEKKFTVRFFPEGGQLVKGISSIVAFEATSRDKGAADVEGTVVLPSGEELAHIRSLHDGMGYFEYKPEEKAGVAKIDYEGSTYQFDLPEALPQGYVLRIDNRREMLDITVARSSQAMKDTLAVFVSSQGRPYKCMTLDFEDELNCQFRISTKELPPGVQQISLVNLKGETLCERFCYVMPRSSMLLACKTDHALYRPFEPVTCRIKVRDHLNRPVQANLSVSIRNGVESDFREYDHSIYTDLLLVSDLKGYIHQPGFYFENQSAERFKMLDVLLLVRGWRKYDLSRLIGKRPFLPRYLPETSLTLYGQVESYFGKALRNVGVSILARRDSVSIAGMTKTDSLGYFSAPVDGFSGSMDALIQTRNEGKKWNKQAVVKLFRNFEPSLRKLDYYELNPEWKETGDLKQLLDTLDIAYKDSVFGPDHHLLDEVVVNAKRLNLLLKQTERFEKEILGYYNITQVVDKMRDKGEAVYNLPMLLKELNPNFRLSDSLSLHYNNSRVLFIVNGGVLSYGKTDYVLDKDVDAIKSIMLYYDQAGGESVFVMNKQSNRVTKFTANNFWSGRWQDGDLSELPLQDAIGADSGPDALWGEKDRKTMKKGPLQKSSVVVCSITTIDDWDPNKTYKARRGIRHTYIQGYNGPLEFYSPAYPDGAPLYTEDSRRTLYWNPNVKTNEKGEAVIRCYNSDNSAPLIINVETLYKGSPSSLNIYSIDY